MLKLIKGIVKLATAVVYAVIIAGVILVIPMVVGYRPVVVLTGSMEPAYPVGSIFYYKDTPFESISKNDVITFKIGEGSLATHRVVEKNVEGKQFVTKGDHNPTNDNNPVPYSKVIGRATDFAIPYVGYAASYLRNWYVLVMFGAVFVLDLILNSGKKQTAETVESSDSKVQTKPKKSKMDTNQI